jgi:hypothetical protein
VRNGDFDNLLDQWTYGAWGWAAGAATISIDNVKNATLQQAV